ncbi:MAG: CRISPR-associated endonuclease, Csn1 family [Firmicutes bacterium]|nr:CRISPR-associated endonuclease, Csn1 family [Bacillota bacterium]
MRYENVNLMQLLSVERLYLDAIKKHNQNISGSSSLSYQTVNELYVSPAVKRQIWQTLTIVREITKVMGTQPERIFVEMARGEEKKKRTVSRKDKLIALYKNCKDEERQWKEELEKTPDSMFRSDRLYLYYTQMGRCMYSDESIVLDELFNVNIYDVDHIFPQSKITDDSIDNRVLVKKIINGNKSDEYPICAEIRNKQKSFWQMLYAKGFISEKKYHRLTRTTAFTDEELAAFIGRQLVETRQSTKAVAHILKQAMQESEIVYVKAGNVAKFRQEKEFIKVRELNDYHHAKDAYLNIVVGNVYHTKFTENPIYFIQKREKYSLNKVFDFPVIRNGKTAWLQGNGGSIKIVRKMMQRNDILFTRYAREFNGAFYDLQLVKKGKGQAPIKSSNEKLKDITKYGGYNGIKGAYFMLVEHEVKGKKVRSIEYYPTYLAVQKQDTFEDKQQSFCENKLALVNPKILIRKIKIDTLLYIDGFYMHLSGRSEDSLLIKGANQLLLSQDKQMILKNIIKFVERREKNPDLKIQEKYDKITKDNVMLLYDEFQNKLINTCYKVKLSKQAETLQEKKEKFKDLILEDQCSIIVQLLHLFQCNSVLTNLSLMGGSKEAGKLKVSKNINKKNHIKMINQSPTGIYEKEIDLLNL